MVHDFAITDRFLVVPLPPLRFVFDNTQGGPRRFAMDAGEPLRVLVARKDDLAQQRVLELPSQFVFHVGNAHEERDGSIVLSYVGAADASFLDAGAVALMRGERPASFPARTCIARLDAVRGTARVQRLEGDVEFPRVHPAFVGRRARWLVAASAPRRGGAAASALLHGVQVLDTDSGRVQLFDYGSQAIAEEHIVVPKPGRSGERDAWLLGTVYDARRDATVLNLLDMAQVQDGPLAQAVLPYRLPLGFHGHFRAA
jgi:carotenoid cleavage dioxygenase-like enzyme